MIFHSCILSHDSTTFLDSTVSHGSTAFFANMELYDRVGMGLVLCQAFDRVDFGAFSVYCEWENTQHIIGGCFLSDTDTFKGHSSECRARTQ
jgi:hypothetical protein